MTLNSFNRPLVMIGCGNMAGAILARWLGAGLSAASVTVVDPGRTAPPSDGITLLPALPPTLPARAVIMLGVKPQSLPDIAPALAPLLDQGHLVISMLAGVTTVGLRSALGKAADLVRIMPNTPAALGKGVVALYADARTDATVVDEASHMLAPLGLVERIADEAQLNLITALTGCGPAFVFRFIDALAQAATALGLEPDQSARLALATVEGASALAAQANEDPAILADKVASKGGMTREGLDVMDEEGRLIALLGDTLRAARDRGEALERLAAASG
ncbi:pyrroline-5-carboxylate reductase [Sphingobium sp. DEHP117]|uniref:pyrroline-5-carboxylate reductase n=1 Tax=Sphingobium sp. DEHP117 TaxID=2993436 RepID=UPI0027D4FC7C|nr:pyrroline-5-carboxylate reductase [Sphingobium sp. DEHP117]MDQ4420573.1 pyrroline-5-carboxylate reductase [Sphingobium sp. DEHP117]